MAAVGIYADAADAFRFCRAHARRQDGESFPGNAGRKLAVGKKIISGNS